LNEADFDLSLTGFDPKELDDLLLDLADDGKADAAPPLPENPVSRLGGSRSNSCCKKRSPICTRLAKPSIWYGLGHGSGIAPRCCKYRYEIPHSRPNETPLDPRIGPALTCRPAAGITPRPLAPFSPPSCVR
jgi:hypothetical protein